MELTEFEISLKKKNTEKINRQKVQGSEDAYSVFKEIFDADVMEWREEMVMLLFNRRNELIGFYKVSSGGMAGTICDPKVVFTIALNAVASGIILAHNHPSGDPTPSHADKELARKIKEGGELLDIKLLDNLIITSDNYYSMADLGLL